MKIGAGNFDVIARDLVEADLQRGDAGAFAFALFHGSDDLFAVLAEVAEFVEFGVETGTNHAGVGGQSGWLVGDTVLDPFLGTGTTSLAASMFGRNSIGFEIDESYFKFASDRLAGRTSELFSAAKITLFR